MKQRDIMRAILDEFFEPSVQVSSSHTFPGWIKVGDEGLVVSQELGQSIRLLSDALYDCDATLTRSMSRNGWEREVRHAIAPLLVNIELEDSRDEISDVLLRKLKNNLESNDVNSSATLIFGCSLFHHAQVDPIVVGPVTFWPRQRWLDEALDRGQISQITHRRLRAKWTGVKNKTRKPGCDAASEMSLLESIGSAPFVCSVKTNGLYGEVAHEKAIMAARLAMSAISLSWKKPSAALANMNFQYDGPPYIRRYVICRDDRAPSGGLMSMRRLMGQSLGSIPWANTVAEYSDVHLIVGEVIQYFLSPDGKVSRPNLMDVFAHSLIWFHEACREEMPMIAVTKFVASIDSLAYGSNGAGGLICLVTARFGSNPDDCIRPEGPTFHEALTNLYKEGRSQPLHGSSKRLSNEWSGSRDLAESFARHALVLCLEWAALNSSSDDPRAMAKSDPPCP